MSKPKTTSELWICELGTVPYREATRVQEDLRARRWAGELPDVMLLLEHPPTYTRGRRSSTGELPFGEDHYRRLGIEVADTDRGGRITYHGPGQLVGYPIVGVEDVVAYVRDIEAALVAALADEGVQACSRAAEGPDFTGVWVDSRKIASIGVHVSRGVTTHGFAVNVDNDLEPFSWIVPCGLAGVRMTSLARERVSDVFSPAVSPRASRGVAEPVALSPLFEHFRGHVGRRFCEVRRRRARVVSALELGIVPQIGCEEPPSRIPSAPEGVGAAAYA